MRSMIYLFSTKENDYIYDGCTGEIWSVDERSWNATRAYIEANELGQEINNLRNVGINFSKPNFKFSMNLAKSSIIELLRNELSTLILETTQDCNLKCGYCAFSGAYHYERRHSSKKMPYPIAYKAMELLCSRSKKVNDIDIGFYGGEPFLNYDLIRNVVKQSKKIFNEKNLTFSVTTNGTLFNEEIVNFLIENNFLVHISLDGPKAIHDKWRSVKGNGSSYDQIMKSLEYIRDYDMEYYANNIGFQTVITSPLDITEIQDFFVNNELVCNNPLQARFVQKIDCKLNFSLDREETKHFSKIWEKLKEKYIQDLINNRIDDSKLVNAIFERPLKAIHRRIKGTSDDTIWPNGICIPGLRKIFINVSGDIFMCEKIQTGLSLGDVIKGFKEQECLKLIDKYIELVNRDCHDCWAVRLCGLCFATASRGNKISLERKRRSCNSFREIISEALKIYVAALEKNKEALDFLIEK